MTTKKRDQRQYDLVQQYLSGLMLNTVLGIIKELGNPYAVRPGLGGMTAYPPGAMAAVCIMFEAQRTTYRKMVGILRNNGTMAAKMGLDRIPSKSTIARAYGLIPEWYLAEAHRIAIREVEAGSLAADSTGYSYLRFVRWLDVRTDSFCTRRMGQTARNRGYPHQGDNRLHGDRQRGGRHKRVVCDALQAKPGHRRLLPGFCVPGKAHVQHDICHGMCPASSQSPTPYATPREASRGARW